MLPMERADCSCAISFRSFSIIGLIGVVVMYRVSPNPLDNAMVLKYYQFMADLNVSIYITLQNEGGFQANPRDRANWTGGQVGVGTLVGTKYGITTLDMPGVEIAALTPAQAVAFYVEHYWKPLYSQINAQPVANKLFDLGVLFGVGEAVKCLQGALHIAADGLFGQETLDAVNAADPAQLVAAFKNTLAKRALAIAQENPNDAADLAGWLRRINS